MCVDEGCVMSFGCVLMWDLRDELRMCADVA